MAPSPGRLLWDLWWLGTAIWPTWEATRPAAELIPGSLGRQHRRRLTRLLNAGAPPSSSSWDPLLGLRPATVEIRWRRSRGRLYAKQRARWRRQPRLSSWSGWPLRGQRVGEASHPGPEPGTRVGGERPRRERSPRASAPAPAPAGVAGRAGRVYCPVPACRCSDPARARGWANEASMRAHIDAHLAGLWKGTCRLVGCRPEADGVHPTCRPEARAAAVETDNMDVDGLALPCFEAIQAGRTRTLRHVPLAARHAWNQVLTRALAAVVHHNSVETWLELLMLPQCVLCAPGRGGRRHRKAAAAFTLDRLQRWQEGERLSLWESRPCCRASRPGPLTPEERRDIATSLGREGFDRKACAALLSKGLCPQTEETARSLAALHPHRPLPAVPAITDLPLAPCMAPELVARCLRAFPAETAPGPSGLRVQHLRDACFAGGTDNFVAQLTAVVELLAQGRAPTAVAPVLAGASLVALPKPAGGGVLDGYCQGRGAGFLLAGSGRRGCQGRSGESRACRASLELQTLDETTCCVSNNRRTAWEEATPLTYAAQGSKPLAAVFEKPTCCGRPSLIAMELSDTELASMNTLHDAALWAGLGGNARTSLFQLLGVEGTTPVRNMGIIPRGRITSPSFPCGPFLHPPLRIRLPQFHQQLIKLARLDWLGALAG